MPDFAGMKEFHQTSQESHFARSLIYQRDQVLEKYFHIDMIYLV